MDATETLDGSEHKHRIVLVGHEHDGRLNELAVVSLITAIVAWPVGLVTALMARREIHRMGERGRGLVLASLIISAVMAATWFALGLWLLIGAINPNPGPITCFGGPMQNTCVGYVNPGGPMIHSGGGYTSIGSAPVPTPVKSPTTTTYTPVTPLPGFTSQNQPYVPPALSGGGAS